MSALAAQATVPAPGLGRATLVAAASTRVADPRLAAGAASLGFVLGPDGVGARITAEVRHGATVVRTLGRALPLLGRRDPYVLAWDGRDDVGRFVTPGSYEFVVSGNGAVPLRQAVHIVRLGITTMTALPSGVQADQWPLVYFKQGSAYQFFAAPAIHPYCNTAAAGERADLDLDSGAPRPPAPLHTATDAPVVVGGSYATTGYNYPLCYQAGAVPALTVVFGATCIGSDGAVAAAGYPIPGLALRCRVRDPRGEWRNDDLSMVPQVGYVFRGPALPDALRRVDLPLTWCWEWSDDGGLEWHPVPGQLTTSHRIYTVFGPPVFAPGATGTQHSGPWAAVVEHLAKWRDALGVDTSTAAGVIEVGIKGFGGQVGVLETAIQKVRYDCYPLGGDGGASHYYTGTSVQLSRLLDQHQNGWFVNCSDVAASAGAMLAMVGVANLQLLRLGPVSLRAVHAIGAPRYTLNLWGGVHLHQFAYHHALTRDLGFSIADACVWVDADGDPGTLPGLPGFNVERRFALGSDSYAALLATNPLAFTLEPLVFLQ